MIKEYLIFIRYHSQLQKLVRIQTHNASSVSVLSPFCLPQWGYGIYYVCRLSMNIVRKPIVEDRVFSETELGIIGSCLFFVYAVGKLTNGFLADRSNVKRFMSTGLCFLLCIDQSDIRIYKLFLCFCLTLGIEWLVPIYGSRFRGRILQAVGTTVENAVPWFLVCQS